MRKLLFVVFCVLIASCGEKAAEDKGPTGVLNLSFEGMGKSVEFVGTIYSVDVIIIDNETGDILCKVSGEDNPNQASNSEHSGVFEFSSDPVVDERGECDFFTAQNVSYRGYIAKYKQSNNKILELNNSKEKRSFSR